MEILHDARSELAWPRTVRCPHCQSVLRVELSDIGRNSDYLGEFTSWWITCPVCSEQPDVPSAWWQTISRLKRQAVS